MSLLLLLSPTNAAGVGPETTATEAPTELDLDLVPAALELLTDFGQIPTSYRQVTAGAYDPVTDRASMLYADVTATAGKVSPPQIISEGMVSGNPRSLVRVGDAITYMAASGATIIPVVGDRIVFFNMVESWEMIRVEPLMSGVQNAAWKIILRAASDGEG